MFLVWEILTGMVGCARDPISANHLPTTILFRRRNGSVLPVRGVFTIKKKVWENNEKVLYCQHSNNNSAFSATEAENKDSKCFYCKMSMWKL